MTSPKLFIVKFFFVCTLVTVLQTLQSVSVYAQPNQSLKQDLSPISRQMYKGGNIEFIFVDALSDSLIKEKEPFTFECELGQVRFNGKELPLSLKDKYTRKIKAFYTKNDPNKLSSSVSIKSPGLLLAQVTDPNSNFRKGDQSSDLTVIIDEMTADKLIDNNKPAKVVYTIGGITINGQPIPGRFKCKYEKRFMELVPYANMPKEEGDTVAIENTPGGPCRAPRKVKHK